LSTGLGWDDTREERREKARNRQNWGNKGGEDVLFAWKALFERREGEKKKVKGQKGGMEKCGREKGRRVGHFEGLRPGTPRKTPRGQSKEIHITKGRFKKRKGGGEEL